MKHTPTPWRIDKSELPVEMGAKIRKIYHNLILRGADGEQILGWVVFKNKKMDAKLKEDMQFIVRACNAYEKRH